MKRIFATLRSGIVLASLLALVATTGCSKDEPTRPGPKPSETSDADINRWMFDYMKTHYLWNEAVKKVKPDYSLEYEEFLEDILKKVATQNDVNHDDGHWEKGKRSYFYSNIQRKNASTKAGIQTRGTDKTANGLGIEMMIPYYKDESKTSFIFGIAAVTPDSPADKAGLKRGDFISQVDGAQIKNANLENCWEKLLMTESGTVRMTRYDMNTGKTGSDISITAASYEDNPVWMRKTITTDSGKKVGYLCYGSFNYYYDDKLIEAFKEFRKEKIDELVLDLRYNGGGHVVSSAVLATLIAGEAHRGDVYARTTYNADRKGETADVYKLGVAEYNTPSSKYRHDPIETALASALGLKQVYVLCTVDTASASELVVNGLRGLDFKVNLIGSTTNGKNVGMEPQVETFGKYEYDFSPITFYIENAEGERDYGDGFKPDVEAEDYLLYKTEKNGPMYPMAWGDEEHDEMLFYAMQWIETGVKPVPAPEQTAATRAFGGMKLRTLAPARVQNMVLLPRSEE